MNKRVVLGVVGKTGSGKSTFAAYLKSKGFIHLDLDVLGKQLPERYPIIKKNLVESFGCEAVVDHKVNGSFLSSIVFRDRDKLNCLNEIFFPFFRKEVSSIIKESKKNILLDGVIIFESGLDKYLDKSFYITAPNNKIISRLQRREPQMKKELLLNRVKIQDKYALLKIKCDYVLDNNSSFDLFYREIDKVLEGIMGI